MWKIKNLNNALDYKKAMTTHLADLKDKLSNGEIAEDDIKNKEGKLLIHTHTSIIEGSINLFQSDEHKQTFIEYGLAQFEEELAELSDDMNAFNVSAPIHIKNAIIKPFSNPEVKTKMSEMIVYSDQVVGISISLE
ncbi:hypothetical protein Q7A53_08950 [Halobacillus rhizosphaerae]|uniref:hypothetical protein n=1 Tax=Halobacillus rhizosphaerae TaxID=3064889 RepID=UPI00398A58C7